MSLILLSDSAQRSSDEHRAFDLTHGRRLTPVSAPAQKDSRTTSRPEAERLLAS